MKLKEEKLRTHLDVLEIDLIMNFIYWVMK